VTLAREVPQTKIYANPTEADLLPKDEAQLNDKPRVRFFLRAWTQQTRAGSQRTGRVGKLSPFQWLPSSVATPE